MEITSSDVLEDSLHEQLLEGGRTAAEVVRIGDTVHRTMGEHSEFTHALLKLLEDKEFKYAPRFLGIDEKGREILSFIEGDTPHDKIDWSNEQLTLIAKIIREFHDATAGTKLAQDKAVVCHHDLAPWNIILNGHQPKAFIDYDEAAPGKRMDDFGYFLWTFLELGNDIAADIQAPRIRMLCDAYGFKDRTGVIDAISNQQQKILNKREKLAETAPTEEERQFSAARIRQIETEIDWIVNYRAVLE